MDTHKIIHIDNGKPLKCPVCNTIYAVENGKEILYKGITLLHRDKTNGLEKIKCKQCKSMIEK